MQEGNLTFNPYQVVPRQKTPQEILEEYERLSREREERRLEQRTNPKVGLCPRSLMYWLILF